MTLPRIFQFPRPRRITRRAAVLGLVFSCAVLVSLPAFGADGRPGFQLELAASSLEAEGESLSDIFGVRGSYDFSRRWALEGGLFRLDEESIWIGDLSAKLYLFTGRKHSLFLSGGPSLVHSSEESEQETMVHLGLGAELGLSRRFYLRPEVRGRWFTRDVNAISILDLSVGFGWRF